MNPAPSSAGDSAGYYLLAFAILSAAVLVLPGVATSPLGIDEHVSYWIAGSENPGTLMERSLNYAATPPVSSLVQRAFIVVGGKSEFWMRLPSVIGFLCAITFTFLFARDLLGSLPAGLAVQLLVWHPDALDRMRQARPYGISLAFAAALLWLTGQWARKPDCRRQMLLWTITAIGLIWTHYLNAPLVGLCVLWLCGFHWLKSEGQQSPRWPLWVAVGIVTLATLPLIPSLLRLQEWSAALNFRGAPPPLWKGLGPYWWFTLPVGAAVAWLLSRILPGQPNAVPLRRHGALLVVLGCLPIVVFAAFPGGSLATLAEPRYRLVYAPASVVLLAGCLVNHRMLAAALLAGVIGIGGAWWSLGEYPWRSVELSVPAAADWTKLTRQLQQAGRADEPMFVYSGLVESRLVPALFEDKLFLDYVSSRAGRFIIETPHPRYALPWNWVRHEPLLAFYDAALDETARNSDGSTATVWLIASVDTDLGRDTVQRFTELAAKHRYRETERTSTDNAVLVHFERTPD